MALRRISNLRLLRRAGTRPLSSSSEDVLVYNCGSSSIKFKVVNPETREVRLQGIADRLDDDDAHCADLVVRDADGAKRKLVLDCSSHESVSRAIGDLVSGLDFAAVGHRVVHGGDSFRAAAVVDDAVLAEISRWAAFAPLHNPNSIVGIKSLSELFKDKTQVVVFDTAFHQTMPPVAYRYGLPKDLYEEHKIRRYGFHGNSHKFVAEEAAAALGDDGARIVTAHLGNGCSVAAVRGGVCVDTSMGLSPLEGLMMGRRSGDVDPSVFKVLRDQSGYGVDETLSVLNSRSGFLGVSGYGDSRDLEDAVTRGEAEAALALDMFCYRLAKYVASYAVAALGGIDALVFTAGIGERSPMKRARVLEYLAPLGFEVDAARNEVNARVVSPEGRSPVAMVIPTDEELVIARETRNLLKGGK